MKALRQNAFGDPAEVVELVSLPDEAPSADQVIVEIEVAAVHLADLKFIQGDPGFRFFGVPRWMGEEGVGTVLEVGASQNRWAVGDRVFIPQGVGAFRDRAVVDANALRPAPQGDAEQLALVTINGFTAYVLLEDFLRTQPGEWFIQNGGNSSCGRFLIALAKRKGAKSVSLVRRDELIPELKALGADVVLVDDGDAESMREKVTEATGGEPIPAGLDCVAGPATGVIARCLATRGRVVNYGFMTGLDCQVPFIDLFANQITLEGMSMATDRTPEQVAQLYAEVAELVGTGELRAKVGGTYALEDAQAAFAHQGRTGPDRTGKILFRPNG